MTYSELHEEQFTVLPLRLETIVVSGAPIAQSSWLNQNNFNNQIGGDCIKANCSQTSIQVNAANVHQTVRTTTTITDVIEDNRKLAQQFFFGPAGSGY